MKVQKGTEPQFGSRMFPTWGDLGIIIAAMVAVLLLVGVCGFVLNLFKMPPAVFNFVTYLLTMGLILGFIIVYRKQRKAPKIKFSAPYRKMSPLLLLWGVVLMVIASFVIEPLLDAMPEGWLQLVKTAVGKGGWAIATTVIVAPILEELIFRGYILGSIRIKMGTMSAIVLSATMFGLIHIIPQQVVNGFVMGLILGYVYVRSGSLVVVILMHAFNNAIAYIQMQLGAESLRKMIENNTLYWILYGIAVAVAIVSIWGIVKALKKENEKRDNSSSAVVDAD